MSACFSGLGMSSQGFVGRAPGPGSMKADRPDRHQQRTSPELGTRRAGVGSPGNDQLARAELPRHRDRLLTGSLVVAAAPDTAMAGGTSASTPSYNAATANALALRRPPSTTAVRRQGDRHKVTMGRAAGDQLTVWERTYRRAAVLATRQTGAWRVSAAAGRGKDDYSGRSGFRRRLPSMGPPS